MKFENQSPFLNVNKMLENDFNNLAGVQYSFETGSQSTSGRPLYP